MQTLAQPQRKLTLSRNPDLDPYADIGASRVGLSGASSTRVYTSALTSATRERATAFSASSAQPPLSLASRRPHDKALEAWDIHLGMSGLSPWRIGYICMENDHAPKAQKTWLTDRPERKLFARGLLPRYRLTLGVSYGSRRNGVKRKTSGLFGATSTITAPR